MILRKSNLKHNSGDAAKLSEALEKLKKEAKEGRRFADDALNKLKRTVSGVSDEIAKNEEYIKNHGFNSDAITSDICGQLKKINDRFVSIEKNLRDDIGKLSDEKFSIVLFGKTMAGKSTLMEILTHGNGESIGKGGQRTTLDVRSYEYKGMMVTDVPGVAAFGGEEDSMVAYEAAKKADLILFLIKNDGIQKETEESLAQLRRIGKPVLIICNIKHDFVHAADSGYQNWFEDFRGYMDAAFGAERMTEILIEYRKMLADAGRIYGQDWRKMEIVFTHLQAAFAARHNDYPEHSNDIWYISRFSYVERKIASIVVSDGCFFKFRAFVDLISNQFFTTTNELFLMSARNGKQEKVFKQKRFELGEWTERFKNRSATRVDSLISQIFGELERSMTGFIDENFETPKAGEKWQNVLEQANIEERCNELMNELAVECKDEIEQIGREIDAELKFTCDMRFEMPQGIRKLFNTKRLAGWMTVLVGVGLTIGAIFAPGAAGVLGVSAAIASILGSIFTSFIPSMDDQRVKAKESLRKQLRENTDKILNGVKKEMLDQVKSTFIGNWITSTQVAIDGVMNSVHMLSGTQQKFAGRLGEKLESISMALFTKALSYIGFGGIEYHIDGIARNPGSVTVIVLRDGVRLPDEIKPRLEKLFGERIEYTFSDPRPLIYASRIIGRDFDRDEMRIERIDDVDRILHVGPRIDELDDYAKAKIPLAQQLTGLLIIK